MKKIFNFLTFLEPLQFIFKPRYWIMLGKYDKQWDAKLNALAKEHDFKSETSPYNEFLAHVSLNGHHMWVGNFPYSCFVPETIRSKFASEGTELCFYEHADCRTQPRPSRLTIHKLRKKLIADMQKQGINKQLMS